MAGEFGLVLRKVRKDAGLTLQDVADALNTNKGAIFRWESGEHFPHPHTVVRLAELYSVPITLLITIARWEKEKRKTGRSEDAEKFLASYLLSI